MRNKNLLRQFGSMCVVLMLGTVVFMVPCGEGAAAPEKITIICAHSEPLTSWNGQAFEKIKALVNERTNGEVRINHFPGGQLYPMEQALPALQQGAIQMAICPTYFLASLDPAWVVINAPMMLKSFDHFLRIMDTDAGKALVKSLEEKQNIKILIWDGTPGPGWLYSKKPVRVLEDWKGLKVRAPMDKVTKETVSKLGGSALSVPYGEISTAVQQGMVDAIVTNAQTAIPLADAPRNLPFCTMGPGGAAIGGWPMSSIATNAKFWAGLPGNLRTTIMECVTEVTMTYTRHAWVQNHQAWLDKWHAARGTLDIIVSDAEWANWMKLITPVLLDSLTDKSSKDVYDACIATAR